MLVQLSQPIVRHGGEEVVRQVIVLAHREDGEVDERVDEEDARVGQPAAIAVAVLHELPQDHEERERREDRHQPQEQVIKRRLRPSAGEPGQSREEAGDEGRGAAASCSAAKSPDAPGSGGTSCSRQPEVNKPGPTAHSAGGHDGQQQRICSRPDQGRPAARCSEHSKAGRCRTGSLFGFQPLFRYGFLSVPVAL